MRLTEQIKRWCHDLYIITANTVIILVSLVMTTHIILEWHSNHTEPNYAAALSEEQREAYRQMSDSEINDLLMSTWHLPAGGFEYDEWVGFKEAPRETKFINVNTYGLRQNSSKPILMDDLNNAIWFFGGSTTFGYGVADQETIPAQLENLISARVYNFGRGYFYSAQENQLLRLYLKAGYHPRLAIFLDGLNERCTIEIYQDSMKTIFRKAQSRYSWDLVEAVAPIAIFSERITTKIGIKGPHKTADDSPKNLHDLSCLSYGMDQPLKNVLRQNLLERQFLCAEYSVNCMTYVQPIAGIHGIHADEKSLTANNRKDLNEKFLSLAPTWRDFGSIFITNSLDNFHKHAYVDAIHYSAEANGFIAKEMAETLKH